MVEDSGAAPRAQGKDRGWGGGGGVSGGGVDSEGAVEEKKVREGVRWYNNKNRLREPRASRRIEMGSDCTNMEGAQSIIPSRSPYLRRAFLSAPLICAQQGESPPSAPITPFKTSIDFLHRARIANARFHRSC